MFSREPMAVLDNARHERFAQALARGETATEAYVLAGYKHNDGNASALANKPSVQERVKEITGAAAERAGVTAERVIAELARLAFSDLRQVVSWRTEITVTSVEDEEGGREMLKSRVTVLDSAEISDDAAAAISETSQGANGTLRIKMHDKAAALEKLGRTLGIFKDRVELAGMDGPPVRPTIILTGRPEPAPPSQAVGGGRKSGH